MKALNDYVIVRVEIAPNTTSGGITLPDSAVKPLHVGEVVSVGPEVDEGYEVENEGDKEPPFIRLGARVVLPPRQYGVSINVEGIDYQAFRAKDLIALV